MKAEPLGVTVMPEWFQYEGVSGVLDRLQSIGATALVTSPYVMEACADGEGGREPPPDGDAGRVRPLDRDLWGRRELWIRTSPALVHETGRYAGLRYQPTPPSRLTHQHATLLDDVCAAAATRGIAVYLQVMAASPPGYRVQFSGAEARDQCLDADGEVHAHRVDRNASLASKHVVAYIATLVEELATRFPGIAGVRLDWPEYPPYDLRSALFDFNPALLTRLVDAGADPVRVRRDVRAWLGQVQAAARASAAGGPAAVRAALLAADWNALTAATGPLAPLFAAKRGAARALLVACRAALDRAPGPRRRLEPQAFPPPFHRLSGFPLDALDGTADAIGIKLYTMHWPMLARYWARDLAPAADAAGIDAITAAVADLFGLCDGPVPDGSKLRYPEPQEAHPVGADAQRAKIATAREAAAPVPIRAFVHSYGPVADVVSRLRIAAGTGVPLWINRYGYLSDAKFAAIAAARRAGA